jgi:[acyl-carrier-protein] S-malonyltransferase
MSVAVKKKRALVVCPGRGTYTKDTLGFLKHNANHVSDFIADLDQRRLALNEPAISALDSAEVFKPNVHTKGENASTLIYACAYADFMAINREKYDICAITGNSMGWYLTLAFAGALDQAGGFSLINTMGGMMKETIIGGQVIYPVVDENWQKSPAQMAAVEKVVALIRERPGHDVYPSIYLGGYIVLGGNQAALNALLKELPKIENYPFQLLNHAAFHTPLLQSTSRQAFSLLGDDLFHAPLVPMVDGRGQIWTPYSTDTKQLRQYTLGTQVVAPYDFTLAVSVGLKEFLPDVIILLGPGSSLGGAVGQILIELDWYGMKSKVDFTARQESAPLVLAMGRPEQRSMVVG